MSWRPAPPLAEIELEREPWGEPRTLREALRHLQQEGLLTSDSRGRLSVRVVSEKEVQEIFDVRMRARGDGVREICAALTDRTAIVRELQEYLDALRDTEGDFVAQLNADLALHERMCALSGNGTLTHTWLGVSRLGACRGHRGRSRRPPCTTCRTNGICRSSRCWPPATSTEAASSCAATCGDACRTILARMRERATRLILAYCVTQVTQLPRRSIASSYC